MTRFFTFSSLLLVLLILPMQGLSRTQFVAAYDAPDTVSNRTAITSADVSDALQSSPVMFIENMGQFDEDARFKVRGGNYNWWLADDALWVTLLNTSDETALPQSHLGIEGKLNANREETSLRRGVNLKLLFVDANLQPEIEPFNLLETKMNYFLGNNEDKWRSNVPVWGGVRYKEIYPGIDLELTSENGHFVQRLVVDERANLDAVQWRVEGAQDIDLLAHDINGQAMGLSVKTAIGDVTLPLFALVTPNGSPLDITSSPSVSDSHINAPFARPSSSNDLLLAGNPSLAASTFIGGSDDDYGSSLALDSANNAIVIGETWSADFPTTAGSYDITYNEGYDGGDLFVLKLNAAGDALIYSTFIGGTNSDTAYSLTLDSADNPVVTGSTYSDDFPTTEGSYDTTHNGDDDILVLKLNAVGDTLIYSTFIGGSDSDIGSSVALDSADNIVVAGSTYSADYPTTAGSYDTSYNGQNDIIVLKLNALGNALVYNTLIGGRSYDIGSSLVLDSAGNAIVTGLTSSSNYPTTIGSYDTTHNGSADTFVLKLNAGGDAISYSTFIGGSSDDQGHSLALDSAERIIVTGATRSPDFPTTIGSYDPTYNNTIGNDVFLLQLSFDGDNLNYSTFIGGSSTDFSYSLLLDSANNPIITGYTSSLNFPTTENGYDTTLDGENDGFVAKLNATGNTLIYGTFIGGSSFDFATSSALHSTGSLVVTGQTESDDFPTTAGSYDPTYNNNGDTFVLRLDGIGSEGGLTYSISGRVTNTEGAGIEGVVISAARFSAETNSNGDYTISGLTNGPYTLKPSKIGHTFDSASRVASLQDADVIGQDFIGIVYTESIYLPMMIR